MRNFFLLLVFGLSVSLAYGQKPRTQFNGFGHIEHQFDPGEGHEKSANFTIGEHDFFVTSAINNKISFLGEYVIRFNSNSATTFLPSIERSFLKFNYYKNHNIIVGKVHTPVNYWNDVYHHGRLFFPVIERPIAFSHLVPLHTTGVQFQGQNLGDANFGYDIVYGNGISSSDGLPNEWLPSITAAVHFKPKPNFRIGASYYHSLVRNAVRGSHVGHLNPRNVEYTGPIYKGDVRFNLFSASAAYFGDKVEVLDEFSYNHTQSDSLGGANNFSNFLYAGYRINEKSVPFIQVDFMHISRADLYTYPYNVSQIAIGYRHEFTPYVNLKVEADFQKFDRYTQPSEESRHHHVKLKVQLAYGF
jgi:hypothetical protein